MMIQVFLQTWQLGAYHVFQWFGFNVGLYITSWLIDWLIDWLINWCALQVLQSQLKLHPQRHGTTTWWRAVCCRGTSGKSIRAALTAYFSLFLISTHSLLKYLPEWVRAECSASELDIISVWWVLLLLLRICVVTLYKSGPKFTDIVSRFILRLL